MTGRKGFTLLELLMVVVILGILGAVAIPQYLKLAEKTRMSEAIAILGAIRSSQIRYHADPANLSSFATTLANLDFDPTVAADVAGAVIFTYTTTTTGEARAVRNATPAVGAGCEAAYELALEIDGDWRGRNCQSTATF